MRYSKTKLLKFFWKDIQEFWKTNPHYHMKGYNSERKCFLLNNYVKQAMLKKNSKKYMRHDLIYQLISLIYTEPKELRLSVSMGRETRIYYFTKEWNKILKDQELKNKNE